MYESEEINEPVAVTVDRKEWDRLRAIVAKVEDVEHLAGHLWSEDIAHHLDESKKIARAVRDYALGEG